MKSTEKFQYHEKSQPDRRTPYDHFGNIFPLPQGEGWPHAYEWLKATKMTRLIGDLKILLTYVFISARSAKTETIKTQTKLSLREDDISVPLAKIMRDRKTDYANTLESQDKRRFIDANITADFQKDQAKRDEKTPDIIIELNLPNKGQFLHGLFQEGNANGNQDTRRVQIVLEAKKLTENDFCTRAWEKTQFQAHEQIKEYKSPLHVLVNYTWTPTGSKSVLRDVSDKIFMAFALPQSKPVPADASATSAHIPPRDKNKSNWFRYLPEGGAAGGEGGLGLGFRV
jgi:hypothetical protein